MGCKTDCCCRKSDDVTEDGDENKKRGNWSRNADFFVSVFGYVVGLGNIWRFPYLCYLNGGGAFLLPYLFFLFVTGWPMFFLEVAYAQFSSLSPIPAWRISPFFKGVGCGMVVISILVAIYYNVIIAWSLYYFGISFTSELPWATCNNTWNTDACVVRNRNDSSMPFSTAANGNYSTSVSLEYLGRNLTEIVIDSANNTNFTVLTKRTSPSEEFWERNVLQITSGIEDMGGVRWELVACLAVTWLLTWICVANGIKSSGKVVYVTALAPCVIQFIMLCRGVTLPGALEGIKYYIIPEWKKLLSIKVWCAAATQIAYSNGAGWGGTITMASYNKFHKNCYREAIVISSVSSLFSIFSGFVVFSIIGYVAHEVGAKVEDVVSDGPGLIFIIYPAALARLPFGPVWSVLFFLMIFFVGLDSQFGNIETVMTTIFDYYPEYLQGRLRRMVCGGCLCGILFLLGVPCVMQGGAYVLTLIDWYVATFCILIIFFTELMVISWIYGINQFYKDIELMIGYRPNIIWKIMWGGVTPAMVMFVFLYSLVQHTPVSYGSYIYPAWAVAVGWILAFLSIVPMPIFMVKSLLSAKGSFVDRLKDSVQPAPSWGPALPEYREQYIATLSAARKMRIRHQIHDDHNGVDRNGGELMEMSQKV